LESESDELFKRRAFLATRAALLYLVPSRGHLGPGGAVEAAIVLPRPTGSHLKKTGT